jgi:hypothetical protein
MSMQRGVYSCGEHTLPLFGREMQGTQNLSLVLLQFLLFALYLILLSVLYLIQFGMGLFCLIFLANLTFFAKVLMDPYNRQHQHRLPFRLDYCY